jgi:predicted DsbA family dithiol-disulfide isomerase
VLADIGRQTGLTDDLVTLSQSSEYIEQARDESLAWSERGIGGVPFFIINKRYGLSGAQPASELLLAFEQAQAEQSKRENHA